ncbi:hypothetical protein [Thiocystis violacea]|uniref:hypothetical protein n=1 Tax=Thiocystis violacea TaxID=13725 RepID=UPI001905DB8D|nr:hypothetical protein [Thiocystis violacea]MBK1718526.1 hypothetical protein [Thiocystis violacea]
MTAISGIGQAFPSGGTCPLDFSVALPWGTVSTDFLCTTFENVRGVLEAVFLALWVLIGYRVVAEA